MAEHEDDLTRATYILRPAGKDIRALKKEDAGAVEMEGYCGSFPPADAPAVERRLQTYQATWKKIKRDIDLVVAQLHESTFGDVGLFVAGVKPPEDAAAPSGGLPDAVFHELPAALIHAGISGTEQGGVMDGLHRHLRTRLKDRARCAFLRGSACRTARAAMRALVEGFQAEGDPAPGPPEEGEEAAAGAAAREAESDDEGEDAARRAMQQREDMHSLCQWYESIARRRAEADPTAEPLRMCVLLEDLASFPAKVLHDIVFAMSENLIRVPFVLVAGVSGAAAFGGASAASLQRLLPRSVAVLLRVRHFAMPRPQFYFDAIATHVFLDGDHGLVLGGQVWGYLAASFLQTTHSLAALARAIQLAAMEHYYENALSLLCPPKMPASSSAVSRLCGGATLTEEALPPQLLPRLRALDSLRRPGLELTAADVADDGRLRAAVPRLLLAAFNGRMRARVAMVVWHEAQRAAAGGPAASSSSSSSASSEASASSRRQVYLEYLSGTLLGGALHVSLLAALRMLHTETLRNLAEKWLELLEPEEYLFRDDLTRLRRVLEVDLAKEREEEAAGEEGAAAPPEAAAAAQREAARETASWGHAKRRRMMLATATAAAASSSSGPGPVSAQKRAAMARHAALEAAASDFFRCFCEEHLRPPSRLPLHESFLYDDPAALARLLSPPTRLHVQRALADPRPILQCKCCEEDGEEGPGAEAEGEAGPSDGPRMSAKAHKWDDLTLAFDIFSKSGRLVSLADWFVAFSEAKRPANLELKELQARFQRAVKELDFLGWLRPTGRRPDHVEKALFCLPSE